MSRESPPLELFTTPCLRNVSNTLINTSSFYFYRHLKKTFPLQESFGVDIPAFIQVHEQVHQVWGRRKGKEMFINRTDKSSNWTGVGRNAIKTTSKLIENVLLFSQERVSCKITGMLPSVAYARNTIWVLNMKLYYNRNWFSFLEITRFVLRYYKIIPHIIIMMLWKSMQTIVPIAMSSILFYNERLPATWDLQSPFLDILKEHSQKLGFFLISNILF